MVIPYEEYYLNHRDKEEKRFNLYHYTNTLILLNSLVKNYEGYFFNQRDKEKKRGSVDGVGRKRQRKRGFAQLSISSKCLGIQPLSLYKYS